MGFAALYLQAVAMLTRRTKHWQNVHMAEIAA